MRMFGTTQEHLATVAAKNHRHSTMNPLAQYQKDMSVEEVLNAPMIAWPLTLPMCSPIHGCMPGLLRKPARSGSKSTFSHRFLSFTLARAPK